MIWVSLRAVAKFLLLLAPLALTACPGALPQPRTDFLGPSGMALAGSKWNYIYVANSSVDALQVIQLGALGNVDMVPAPARYFPLYIPAGPNVSEVAATFDGRYVLALDPVSSSLRLVDADQQLLVRDSSGAVLTLAVGGPSSGPGGMIASSQPCNTGNPNCVGRVFVALRNVGAMAVVDVVSADAGPQMELRQVYPVGGAPARMAGNPNTDTIFVTDVANPELIVVQGASTATPLINRIPIGYEGGPVAVSDDGSLLLIGRPLTKDVLVLDTNQFLPVAANPIWSPAPACLQGCNPNFLCASAHPADQALCIDGNVKALDQGPEPAYQALYLGAVPAQIAATTRSGSTFSIPCLNNSNVFSQAAAVATVDGAIYYIGLRNAQGDVAIQLASSDGCQPPKLASTGTDPSKFIAPCPSAPTGSQRFRCVNTGSNSDAPAPGVLTMPGLANGISWQFAWESVLPQLERSNGGGHITTSGQLVDKTIQYMPNSIMPKSPDPNGYPGDILQIVTSGQNPNCADPCPTERHITAVDWQGGSQPQLTLTLDTALNPECYGAENAAPLAYRVRAGSAFLVTTTVNGGNNPAWPPTRVQPGQSLGLGQFNGAQAPFLLTLQDLTYSTGAACDIYSASGDVKSTSNQNPILSRNLVANLTLQDPYAPARVMVTQIGSPATSVGALPGGMVLTRPPPNSRPLLFTSFAGSERVLVSDPSNAGNVNLFDDVNNKILY